MNTKVIGKVRTKERRRGPRIRVAGYPFFGRIMAKSRPLFAGNIGEYHFDCPVDNMLFGFKGVKGDDFKAQIENGASDQEMVEWLNRNGQKKTPDEIKRWGDEVTALNPYNDPERREWFIEQVKQLGLDPAKTTLFDWLEKDDKACHAKKAA